MAQELGVRLIGRVGSMTRVLRMRVGLAEVVLAALAMIIFALLLFEQRRLRNRVGQLGALAEQRAFCRYLPTLQAMLLTVLIGLLWPAVLWFFQWRLTASTEPSG